MNEFNFEDVFKAFRVIGLPDVTKDIDFRNALIDALAELNLSQQKESKKNFLFSEKEYQRQLEIINSEWAGNITKNRAADWVLDARAAGYL